MNVSENITKAAEFLKNADSLLITAGAGMGVDSGLPDFRGNEGFWNAYPPIRKLGLSFSEMANPEWFERNPHLAWAFYGHRLNLYRSVEPHQGFKQLLEIAESKPDGYFVYTSNVDGQFQKAGFSKTLIEEAHGSIHHFQCAEPCHAGIWSAENEEVSVDIEKFEAQEPFPICPKCGRIARPNILMFGDWSWISARANEQASKFQTWLKYLKKQNSKLAIVELGAGNAVPTVRHRSAQICREINANLIRINPRDFDLPAGNHVAIPMGAADGIRKIFDIYKKK